MSITLQDIKGYADSLTSHMNTQKSVYDALSSLAGGQPLTTITDQQIKDYFVDLLSDKTVGIIRDALAIMEAQMPRDRANLTDFDASELKKLG